MRRTGGFQMRRTAAGGLDTLHIVSIRDLGFLQLVTVKHVPGYIIWLYSKLYIFSEFVVLGSAEKLYSVPFDCTDDSVCLLHCTSFIIVQRCVYLIVLRL